MKIHIALMMTPERLLCESCLIYLSLLHGPHLGMENQGNGKVYLLLLKS